MRPLTKIALLFVVALAMQHFMKGASSALWLQFSEPFTSWRLSGIPFYGLWVVVLLIHRQATLAPMSTRWLPIRESYSRTNLCILALLTLLCAFESYQILSSGTALQWPTNPYNIASAVILAPLVEEWLFRGVLWDYFEKCVPDSRTRVIVATVFTSFLFAWWHVPTFDPLGTEAPLVGHFIFGCVMSLLRWRFNVIGVGIVVHALYNLGGRFLVTQ